MSDYVDLICDSRLIVFIISEQFLVTFLHVYYLWYCYCLSLFFFSFFFLFLSVQDRVLAKVETFDCAMDWDEVLF